MALGIKWFADRFNASTNPFLKFLSTYVQPSAPFSKHFVAVAVDYIVYCVLLEDWEKTEGRQLSVKGLWCINDTTRLFPFLTVNYLNSSIQWSGAVQHYIQFQSQTLYSWWITTEYKDKCVFSIIVDSIQHFTSSMTNRHAEFRPNAIGKTHPTL